MTTSLNWLEPHADKSRPQTVVYAADKQWTFWGASEEDHIFKILDRTKSFYELELLKHVSKNLKRGDLVVDVGANMGNHTVFFSGVLGCHVRAFEPVPELVKILTRNVQLNFLEEYVRIDPLAVGASTGRMAVSSWNEKNTGQTQLSDEEQGDIPVVALDDLEWDRPVNLLKIDVEGMEASVLYGATRLIHDYRPMIVAEAQTPDAQTLLRNWLSEHNYVITGLYNVTPTLVAVHADTHRTHMQDRPDVDPDQIMSAIEQILDRCSRLEHHIDILANRVGSTASTRRETPKVESSDQIIQSLQDRVRDLEARIEASNSGSENRS